MRILITGGHLAPVLAILKTLPKSCQVLVVGRKYTFEGDTSLSFEYRTLAILKVPVRPINTGRLQRKFTRHTISSLFKFPLGFLQSFRVVNDFKPDIMLSFGGYVSLPIVLAGVVLRIPVVIHEQTLGAGLANRIAAFFARKVCISWETSRNFFPKEKTVLTGNPVRKYQISNIKYFGRLSAEQISKEKLPLIYITGGSAGSHTINVLIENCLKELLKKFRIIHQIGDNFEFKDFDRLKRLRDGLDSTFKKRYIIAKFITPEAVGEVLRISDLVISRAGINTITELIFLGKPALLIPLNNEQMANAIFMKKIGLAEILLKEKLTGKMFLNLIQSMMSDLTFYNQRKEDAQKIIKQDAAEKIVKVLYDELEGKKKTSKRGI